MPTETFDTLSGGGGPVAFTTASSAYTAVFDTLATAAQPGQFVGVESTTFTQPRLTVEAWNAANTSLVATLPATFNRQFQDEYSDTGSASVTALASDTASLSAKVLRFKVGDVYAFSSRVEQKRWRTVADGEEADQTVTLTGRGILSEWDDAIVFPYGGINARPISDSRGFAWWSPELSTAGWPNATTLYSGVTDQVRTVPPIPDPWIAPAGWPANDNSGADWIWSRYAGGGTPAGISLFRSTFTSGNERIAVFYTAQSRARVWIDGISIADWTSSPNEESFTFAHRATPLLTSGTHTIAVEADTQAWTPAIPNTSRGALLVAVYGGGGSGATYNSSSRLLGSSASWKCLDYPVKYPAPSPGKILSTLLSEAQARGALTGWTLGCTDTADSAGQPWGDTDAFVFRVGQTYLECLRQMADASIEFRARNVGKVLDVWRKDTVTVASGETFSTGNGNLTQLEESQPL